MIPGKGTLFLSPYDEKANGPLKEEFKKQTNTKIRNEYNYCTTEIDVDHILGPEQEILDINMNKLTKFNNQIHRLFTIEITKEGTMGGFVSWFLMNMYAGTFLRTSPKYEKTHWKQQLFKFKNKF